MFDFVKCPSQSIGLRLSLPSYGEQAEAIHIDFTGARRKRWVSFQGKSWGTLQTEFEVASQARKGRGRRSFRVTAMARDRRDRPFSLRDVQVPPEERYFKCGIKWHLLPPRLLEPPRIHFQPTRRKTGGIVMWYWNALAFAVSLLLLASIFELLINRLRAGTKLLVADQITSRNLALRMMLLIVIGLFAVTDAIHHSPTHSLLHQIVDANSLLIVIWAIVNALLSPGLCQNGFYKAGVFIPWQRVRNVSWRTITRHVLLIDSELSRWDERKLGNIIPNLDIADWDRHHANYLLSYKTLYYKKPPPSR